MKIAWRMVNNRSVMLAFRRSSISIFINHVGIKGSIGKNRKVLFRTGIIKESIKLHAEFLKDSDMHEDF